ncbi:Undecaprenyl diphosphate synthase [Testicularia cyperi]|uniref:Alkyl transferase n=1 Tax=Testicularia cyperi TaxID=1882483 RepID=A0A317XYJ9_9BASI|nr:Undecaprenyl diphosphate synthase [Testicularia cyperi]
MPTKTDLLKQAALSPLSLFSLLPLPSLQNVLLHMLSLGPIPRHIAFVMDGNRRWARTSSHTIQQGHLTGFATLKKVLEVCLNLRGLDTVTVYAFAIDNFKRSDDEVRALMEIARTRLIELAGHGELIARYQVRVRIVGRKELLPRDVLEAVERVENMTRGNTKATLNICMPYASRDEIAGAARTCLDRKLRDTEKDLVKRAVQARQNSDSCDSDMTWHSSSTASTSQASRLETDPHPDSPHFSQSAMDAAMQLAHSPPLDILVRTSGVSRLSDFMLWQCNDRTRLHFVNKFWPQFGLLDMIPIILDWQRDQWSQSLRKSCGWEPTADD